ncbi:MAG: sulfite exporter TauE/SafE family protein [Pseudomonadota bacterium]
METETLLIIAFATFLFAGTMKGIVGIGLPSATVSILSQFTDPRHAIALLLLPSVISNVWQVYRTGYFMVGVRTLLPFAIMLFVFIWLFSQLAATLSVETLVLGCGVAIVLFVLSNVILKPYEIPPRLDFPFQIGAGLVGGIMGGLTAIWAPAMAPYLVGKKLSKDDFVGALGFLILAGTFPLLFGYIQAGLLTGERAVQSAIMIIPTLAGFWLGEQLRKRVDGKQFRALFLFVFFLMGLNLIRRALF